MSTNETRPAFATAPDPALRRLDRLVGTWTLVGRSLGSDEDDISGRLTMEWMPGGFFMLQHGDWDIVGMRMKTLEILHYDPETDTFPATVYTSMTASPLPYHWEVSGNAIRHWVEGATYTGEFSDDGDTITGGWRPSEGVEQTAGNAYDATMTRVR